jgi:hypothetical protein
MKTILSIFLVGASVVGCAPTPPPAKTAAPGDATPVPAKAATPSSDPAATATPDTAPRPVGGACKIHDTVFKAGFAKRENDDDKGSATVYIFPTSPANAAEKASACVRAKPVPAWATRADAHIIELDYNDGGDQTWDVTFLTHASGEAFDHASVGGAVVEAKGDTLGIKVKSDDSDCDLTVKVVTCRQ